MSALAQPYRFYLLQRVQDTYASLAADDRTAIDAMLEACGMAAILQLKLERRIGRLDNLEVWEA